MTETQRTPEGMSSKPRIKPADAEDGRPVSISARLGRLQFHYSGKFRVLQIADIQDGPKVSFKEIATKHWRSLLTCIGLVISTNVTYYMLLTYMPSYLSHNLHYSEDHGVLILSLIHI